MSKLIEVKPVDDAETKRMLFIQDNLGAVMRIYGLHGLDMVTILGGTLTRQAIFNMVKKRSVLSYEKYFTLFVKLGQYAEETDDKLIKATYNVWKNIGSLPNDEVKRLTEQLQSIGNIEKSDTLPVFIRDLLADSLVIKEESL